MSSFSTRHPLHSNSAFMHLWAGQSAAQIGFQVGTLATSTIAITVLHANETQLGILGALQTIAFLLVGLPAGAWVDGWRKRRVMIVTNTVRICALLSVPAAYLWWHLTLVHLMVMAAILGVTTVFFDVAYQSYIPLLVGRHYIGDANGRLEGSYQVAAAGGPGLGGWLLDVIAPPLAYVLTGATYIFSTVAIWRIRVPEPTPTRSQESLVGQIGQGISFIRREPLLFPLFCCIAFAAFCSAGFRLLLPVLVLRVLDMSAAQLGVLLSIGALGGILGVVTRPLWISRLGIGRSITWMNMLGVSALLVYPFSVHYGDLAPIIIAVAGVISSYGLCIYNITQMSLRQSLCPPDMLGRMNATFRFAVWGVMPLGSAVAGVIATHLGVENTMYLFCGMCIAASIAMFATPAAHIRGTSIA